MKEKKFLDEEKYIASRKRLNVFAILVLFIAIILFVTLRGLGELAMKSGYDSETIMSKIEQEESHLTVVLQNTREKIRPTREKIELNKLSFFEKEELELSIKEELEIIKEIEDYFNGHFKIAYKANETKQAVLLQEQLENIEVFGTSDRENMSKKDSYNGASNVVLGFSTIIAIGVLLIANQRSIKVFEAQSTVPVTKEIIEEISPSLGKATKEIAKGFKEGVKEDEKNE